VTIERFARRSLVALWPFVLVGAAQLGERAFVVAFAVGVTAEALAVCLGEW
jgi:hypothetical protein